MGLKQDYETYLDGLTDEQVKPIELPAPVNDVPLDMSALMPEVTLRFREGETDWNIAVEFGLSVEHVALGREIWLAEVAERDAETIP
jgi:hypothetical protein